MAGDPVRFQLMRVEFESNNIITLWCGKSGFKCHNERINEAVAMADHQYFVARLHSHLMILYHGYLICLHRQTLYMLIRNLCLQCLYLVVSDESSALLVCIVHSQNCPLVHCPLAKLESTDLLWRMSLCSLLCINQFFDTSQTTRDFHD